MNDFLKAVKETDEYKKSLGKLLRVKGRHLELVRTVAQLETADELIKIRTLLQGRPMETARKLKVEETEQEEEDRVDREVEAARENMEDDEDIDDEDEDEEKMMTEDEKEAELEKVKAEVNAKKATQKNLKSKKKLKKRS